MTNDKVVNVLAEVAAAVDPERCMVRKCVGCTTFDDNPAECGRCYAELYGRTTPTLTPALSQRERE